MALKFYAYIKGKGIDGLSWIKPTPSYIHEGMFLQ